ncbi:uncharacterized protein LOC117647319 [Thrips palmi]|uniref:Uncharacterized protein LOC117647319 n=1 Tax=Thrips palmi TaxID=161013 RepID=A0A6P8ZPY8_THRPL|nr:uncharacterized protein LOC117647319 [Thrips palmi]
MATHKLCVNNNISNHHNNNNNGETLILDIGHHTTMSDDGWQYSGYWESPTPITQDHNGVDEMLHYAAFDQVASPGSDSRSTVRWTDSPFPCSDAVTSPPYSSCPF